MRTEPAHGAAGEHLVESADDMETLGARLAAELEPGDTVLLTGPLGAGKTGFTRGLARALGADPALVCSPSYTLVHHYAARLPVVHVDLYRLESSDELPHVDVDDWLPPEHGVGVIEWAERLTAWGRPLPARVWRVTITPLAGFADAESAPRRVRIEPPAS